jgi:hypothetical protein
MNNQEDISYEDFLSNYLNDANKHCFVRCVKDNPLPNLNMEEKMCLTGCFQKYLISYTNMSDVIKIGKK